MQEAIDFQNECDALAAVLANISDSELIRPTLFKAWTVEDIIGHLHIWNHAAAATLESREKFGAFLTYVGAHMGAGESHIEMQRHWLAEFHGGVSGRALVESWKDFYPQVANAFENADPAQRVAWAGPDMTAQSKIVARQMETWAHGQAVFDLFGLDREETDRIRNITHLGVTTYSWAFKNRGEEPPLPKPFIQLTAPSGAVWEWNERQNDNTITGDAVAFCQVVTQTRNINDTRLNATGEAANRWMHIAQCFAGLPNDPPRKGERYKA